MFIVEGGLEPDLRPDVWPMLFGVHAFNSTKRFVKSNSCKLTSLPCAGCPRAGTQIAMYDIISKCVLLLPGHNKKNVQMYNVYKI